MSKLGHDPWLNAVVWFATATDKPWAAGIVKKNHPSSKDDNEWVFHVEIQQVEVDCSNELIEVHTKAVDSFGLEYQLVKKREQNEASSASVTDMTALSFLNEPEMIQCLKQRYTAKHIYTNIGPILVAVNPFEQLASDVYSVATIERYGEADQAEARRLGPHVFQIGNNAYNRMFIDKYDPDKRENQSILVNGESGAGKTESTKQVLKFLASNSAAVAASLDDIELVVDVESVISAVNPITESFGNAKTARNNNSSRFGKFIELQYVADGYIASAHIQTYLLETVRVTSQHKGERNYHIFYELFAGMSEERRSEWSCCDLKDFRLVNQSGEYNRYDGESDKHNFERLVNAFQTIDMAAPAMEDIFKTVAGILHIGNLSFQASSSVGEDSVEFTEACRGNVGHICRLLGIPEERLMDAVSSRCIKVAGNLIKKQLNTEMATAARDIFAKATYELMFKSIMVEVNRSLLFTEDEVDRVSFIGVLDIFGFEFFEQNSFEQLCINYANEKLQDHFNYAIFQSEKEVYEEEGVKWKFTDYPDNSERLELFEHKSTGLFLLCDEQLKIPKPSDTKLVQSFYAKCSSYKHFTASNSDKGKMEFVVNHFACDVKYKAPGFVEKNRNEIAQEIFDCYQNSALPFMQQFSHVHASGAEGGSGGHPASVSIRRRSHRESEAVGREERSSTVTSSGKQSQTSHHQLAVRKKTTSLASQFSRQLYELISKIRSTRSHFVRCIKPNNQLLANTFDYEMVMSQLRCGGALGAVQVFRAGFPNRMDFKFFVSRYSAFLVLCGVNALTKDLYSCLMRARESGSDDLWKLSASMLIDIVSMTIVILNMSEEAEISSDTNILSGLQMGKTQMFLRVPVFELLERLHVRSMNIIAKRLQRRVRSKLAAKMSGSAKYAASECVMSFAFQRRVLARKCVSATIVLQRRIRVYLAQTMRRKAIRGLTKLKAVFRGYKARQHVKFIKYSSARIIQAKYRMHAAFLRFKKMKISVLRLQCVVRMASAVHTKIKKLKLILDLQCMWRGTQARIRTWAYRQKLKQAQIESQKRAADTKADFMSNLDDKLKSNPNLLFDMLGATEKIAVLSRQNELLMQSNKLLEQENINLRRGLNTAELQLEANLVSMSNMVVIGVGDEGSVVENKGPLLSVAATNTPTLATAVPAATPTPSAPTTAASPQKSDSKASQPKTPVSIANPVPSAIKTPPSVSTPTTPVAHTQVGTTVDNIGSNIDHRQRVLITARESAGAIYKQLGAAIERKAKITTELASSQNENKNLKKILHELTGKKNEATVKLEAVSSFLSEPKDDTAAQLLSVDNQIQIMQKRKATLVKLLGSLQEDRSNFFEADINGAMEALNEIDVKLSELCSQQLTLSKAPIHFTELTHASEKEGVVEAVEEVNSLEADVSFIVDEIKAISQQQTLADLNAREMKLKHGEAIDECDALEASLKVVQDIIRQLDTCKGGQHAPSTLSAVLPAAQTSASSTHNSPMNEMITDKVKEKLSSVRGMMGRMSLGGFGRMSSGAFLSPEKEEPHAPLSTGDEKNNDETSKIDSGDFIISEIVPTLSRKDKWNPGFIGSVGAWARSGKRDVTFIISVRAVDSGSVAEWTVTRCFADFKALRMNMNCDNAVIDNIFPSDSLYSMFTISNETAELRKEGLNTYLLSLCGCEDIMTNVDNDLKMREFLRVDDYMKQNVPKEAMHV